MTQSWQVRLATQEQLPTLTRVLARAFVTEPMMTWPIGALSDPAAAIEASFAIWDAANIELGVVFEAGQGAGVAGWVAPELASRWTELERQARPALHQLSDDGGHRYSRMWEWVERNVAYYVSLGFRVVHDGDAPDGGPHIWFLKCDPPIA